MIIGLVGRARSGKDSVANTLLAEYGYVQARFSKPLKDMLRTLMRGAGCPSFQLDYWIEGAGKELPCPYLQGYSPRHAMQTLGTQWGREHMGADFWAKQALANLPARAVFSDCRFLNEAQAIRNAGGLLVRVHRPCVDVLPANHSSESELEGIACDYHLANTGTLEHLADAVRFMCSVYNFYIFSYPKPPRSFAHPKTLFTGIGK